MKITYQSPLGEEAVLFETTPMSEARFKRLCGMAETAVMMASFAVAFSAGGALAAILFIAAVPVVLMAKMAVEET